MKLLAAILLLFALHAAPARAAAACAYDRAAMLALSMHDFDQTQNGWRSLDGPRCVPAQAELIALYKAQHAPTLQPGEVRMLEWHEAQLHAVRADYRRAIALFERALAADRADPHPENLYYTQATLAFLRRDRPALLEARRRLAALPAPEGFEAAAADYKAKTGFILSWPINLDVIDGFIACFDRPYAEAYTACRPAP